ncbi:class I SAM-dependent methyltransferase [Halobacteriovorax sp.]|uniref:class I SAM-dependent methyltransferase n=1 Tax=Halobacteriovorax sp. TaxID=2020862 RepID=UPI00356811B3
MEIYEEMYQSLITDSYSFEPNDSLIELLNFFKSNFLRGCGEVSYLEIGCGLGFHVNSKDCNWDVEGLELSKSAVVYLSKISKKKVYQSDFLEFRPEASWDLILDSHLLHCTVGVESFKTYFENIFNILNPGGSFLLEVMCSSREMCFDENQFYNDETFILYQDELAIRTILPARDIEKIIIESGLKIVYLRVDEIIKFIPNSHRSESRPTDPDRMRVICLKE